jgi:hypothetical protein
VTCAQDRVPFFSPVATPFDPEISIVNTGIVSDMQAVVSPDNKYVTINARASNSRLLALKEFTFQRPSVVGFVGTDPGAGARNDANLSILDRPGMTRLEPR